MEGLKVSKRGRSIRRRLLVLGLASTGAALLGLFGAYSLEQVVEASGPEVTYCVYYGTTQGPGAYTCPGGAGYYYYSYQQGSTPCPNTASVGGVTYTLDGALNATCPPPA